MSLQEQLGIFSTNTGYSDSVWPDRKFGQSFMARSTYTLTKIKLSCTKSGLGADIPFSLKRISFGTPEPAKYSILGYVPVGDLSTGTLLAAAVGGAPFSTYEITMTPCNIMSGTLYAVVWDMTGCTAADRINFGACGVIQTPGDWVARAYEPSLHYSTHASFPAHGWSEDDTYNFELALYGDDIGSPQVISGGGMGMGRI